ncbi:MAG: hypothetical protein Q9221_008231 [Calogaya cf. arnoldii]
MERELERLAVKACRFHQKPSSQQISRFRRLFNYTESQALNAIMDFRSDMNHQELADEQWTTVQTEKETQGHDRESYEHQRQLWFAKPNQSTFSSAESGGAKFVLFKLREPVPSVEVIQREFGVAAELKTGYDEDGHNADFASVDRETKQAIEKWIQKRPTLHPPSFIPIRQAAKDLSETSCYPTLGIESTLPQYRAINDAVTFAPAQTEYPVWYFFYGKRHNSRAARSLIEEQLTNSGDLGTLANPEELRNQLHFYHTPKLVPASIKGGVLRSWRQKFKALVDGPTTAEVFGQAYRLHDSAHEESLRCREGTVYEVVRCQISFGDGEEVQGLTFRFTAIDQLDPS